MIKRLFILSFLIYVTTHLVAQNYGNEWINYSQKHYRISIPKTGIYRIDYNTLINAGIPLGSINPKNFQLFCKGDEQYININGESDGVFNPTDYIEFYAKKMMLVLTLLHIPHHKCQIHILHYLMILIMCF